MSVYVGASEPERKTFVLCFDGTGNKFSADSSDSNVLKIFRMLDRTQRNQYHYYQPGIGTYVTATNMSETGMIAKLKRSYMKAKDSAIGSSFADHVLGGYKFLMRYYAPGDDIYFFGFSRGSYIARFLAEMVEIVGLLSAGNEELIQFAWKTFAKWQQRKGLETKEDQEERKRILHYMTVFRETFSRPVKRIKFIGLFDTVNSVPRFESAWMQRSKFPFTARSWAKTIRHAVAIDERRAKFRQDLIAESKKYQDQQGHHHHHHHHHRHRLARKYRDWTRQNDGDVPEVVVNDGESKKPEDKGGRDANSGPGERYRRKKSRRSRSRSRSRGQLQVPQGSQPLAASISQTSLQVPQVGSGVSSVASDDSEDYELAPQDIEEVWFPGAHADIGGGWHKLPGEEYPLSHAPLVWMVHEAQRAGIDFDEDKLREYECIDDTFEDSFDMYSSSANHSGQLQSAGNSGPDVNESNPVAREVNGGDQQQSRSPSQFASAINLSGSKGHLHDCLQFNAGLSHLSVLLWRGMEYLPFRRMDLQPDGQWKPIRWPLPCGEVRDIPDEALIHHSAIKRLQHDKDYRPGNLIVGGGGRGVKRAPEHLGIGEWVVARDKDHPVLEVYVRESAAEANGVCSAKGHSANSGEASGETNGKGKES